MIAYERRSNITDQELYLTNLSMQLHPEKLQALEQEATKIYNVLSLAGVEVLKRTQEFFSRYTETLECLDLYVLDFEKLYDFQLDRSSLFFIGDNLTIWFGSNSVFIEHTKDIFVCDTVKILLDGFLKSSNSYFLKDDDMDIFNERFAPHILQDCNKLHGAKKDLYYHVDSNIVEYSRGDLQYPVRIRVL